MLMFKKQGKNTQQTYNIVLCGLFAALIAVCSQISLNVTVPFTMQTFAVFCALGTLGGAWGTAAVLVYIIIGAIGVPVYAGFTGGIGILFGLTGGYFLGFIFSGLIYWGITKFFGKKLITEIIAMVSGIAVCYLFGTLWFMAVSSYQGEPVGFAPALMMCVVPFIIPDAAKIVLALAVSRRLEKYVRRTSRTA